MHGAGLKTGAIHAVRVGVPAKSFPAGDLSGDKMISGLKSEYLKSIGGENSLGTVAELAKNLEERANDMDIHGWTTEAADLRKWALELRAYLASQNCSPNL